MHILGERASPNVYLGLEVRAHQDISPGEGAAYPRKILALLDSSKLGCTLLGAGCRFGLVCDGIHVMVFMFMPKSNREVHEGTLETALH
jgi:hypothetical protein